MDTARTETKPHIFISYSRRDEGTVLPIVRELERQGYRVWYDVGDDGIPGGAVITGELAERISGCGVFLAFLSKNFYGSRWCAEEIAYAKTEGKWIIPVRLDDAPMVKELKFQLARFNILHYADYGGPVGMVRELGKVREMEDCWEEPEPVPPEPEPVTTEPDPAPAEPEPVTTEPDPAPAEPEPETAEPDPTPAEPVTDEEPKPVPTKNHWFLRLAALLLFSAVVVSAGFIIWKIQTGGSRELRWTLENGVLTIDGGLFYGDMPDYGQPDSGNPPPWSEIRDAVTRVVIKSPCR